MSLNTDIINTIDIEQYHTAIEVVVLEDNKFQVGEKRVYQSLSSFIDCLMDSFTAKGFYFNGGNDREIYIANDEREYTFQISPFEFNNDCIVL